MLAGARDAQAALDAVADTEQHAPSHRLSSQSWDTIRASARRTSAHSAETASLNAALRTRISAALDRAEARIERWPLDAITFSDVAEGLRAGYRRARHLIPDDWRAASAQELHELRQRVVMHRYQMEIVEPLWPRLGRRCGCGRRRSCATGSASIRTCSCSRTAEPHQPLARWRSRLLPALKERQTAHVGAAARIAARLFFERPRDFERRLLALAAVDRPEHAEQDAAAAP